MNGYTDTYRTAKETTQAGTISGPAPVVAAQSDLDKEVAQLHEALGALTDRMRPILAGPRPSPVDSAKVPEAANTVANRIYSSASAVRHARERVGELIDRLEV